MNRPGALIEIQNTVSSLGLVVVDLDQTLNKQVDFMNQIWASLLSLSLLSFLSAVASLMGFLTLSVPGQQRDWGIMRALGAKPGIILKVVVFQTFLLVLCGALFGLPVGMAVVLTFLIPEPIVSQNAVVVIAFLIFGVIVSLCLASLVPGKNAARTLIVPAVSRV